MRLGVLLRKLRTASFSPSYEPAPTTHRLWTTPPGYRSAAHQPPSFSNAFLAPLWLASAALRNQYRA